MKKRLLLLFFLAASFAAFAQAPQAVNYQGIARDPGGNAIPNQLLGLRLSIHQGSPTGTTVYQETHTPTTNQFGLYAVQMGMGTPVTGTFNTIVWASGPYFLEVEMDITGGNAYVAAGTSQLISVPYALYAETSGSSTPGPTGPSGDPGAAGPSGPAGATGPIGANGATGATGVTGPAGANGATGATGAAGANGATGPTGAAGANGVTGGTGAAGVNGATGPTGTFGAPGVTGQTLFYNGTNNVVATSTIFIATNGNVGLGTTAPNTKLHIANTFTTSNQTLQFTHTGTGSTLLDGLLIGISGSPGDASILQNEAQPLWFGTSAVERMRIEANGTVGIGTLAPAFTLHVNDITGSGVSIIGESNNAGNSSIYVNSLGANANSGFGYERSGVLRAYSGVNLSNDYFFNVGVNSNVFYVATATGNFGVSNNTPNEKLHVRGANNADVKVKNEAVGNSGSASFQAKGSASATDVFEMTKYNVAAAGTIAGVPLGNLSLLYSGAGAGRMLFDVITNNPMQFGTNNTVRMTIDGAGLVGIGTTIPTRQLDVNGTARIGANGTTITNVSRRR